MKKVLILSCGTGGGHNSAALAIQEALKEKGIQADFVEYLNIINTKLKDQINRLYIHSTRGNGKVLKVVYHLGELYQKTKLKSPIYALNKLNKDKLYQYILNNHYDYVVTTHLFAAEALTSIKKEHPIHFMAVSTDYVSIPFWEETNPDYLVIPSKELEQDFRERGIAQSKLLPLGIPVAKTYRMPYEKDKCRKELNLEENKKYILILTGSMGFGNILELVKKLLEKMKEVTFIISCGHNTKLLENLKANYSENHRVMILPFTADIDIYMKSSDIILTKPGGLTTTEIAALNKPFIHTMPIPGCENYNAAFFSKRKMAMQCDTIEKIVTNTQKLLNSKRLQKICINNQIKYIYKNAAEEIANKIIEESQ